MGDKDELSFEDFETVDSTIRVKINKMDILSKICYEFLLLIHTLMPQKLSLGDYFYPKFVNILPAQLADRTSKNVPAGVLVYENEILISLSRLKSTNIADLTMLLLKILVQNFTPENFSFDEKSNLFNKWLEILAQDNFINHSKDGELIANTNIDGAIGEMMHNSVLKTNFFEDLTISEIMGKISNLKLEKNSVKFRKDAENLLLFIQTHLSRLRMENLVEIDDNAEGVSVLSKIRGSIIGKMM